MKMIRILITMISLFSVSFSQEEMQFQVYGEVKRLPVCVLQEILPVELGVMSTDDDTGEWHKSDLVFGNCDISTESNPLGGTTGVSLEIQGDQDGSGVIWSNSKGSALNIGILLKVEGDIIPPTGSGTMDIYKSVGADGFAIFKIEGQMVRMGSAVARAGTVERTINFIATFK